MNYDHMSFSGDAFGKIDYYAREFRDKLEEKAMQIAQEHGRTEVNKNDVTKAKKELFNNEFVKTVFGPDIKFVNNPPIITGCRSGFTCTNCNAKIVMDSTGSGKAGTNDGDTYYVLGPCTCLLPCPKCGAGSIRNLAYND